MHWRSCRQTSGWCWSRVVCRQLYAASWKGRLKTRLGQPLDSLDALRRDAASRGLGDRLLVTGSPRRRPRARGRRRPGVPQPGSRRFRSTYHRSDGAWPARGGDSDRSERGAARTRTRDCWCRPMRRRSRGRCGSSSTIQWRGRGEVRRAGRGSSAASGPETARCRDVRRSTRAAWPVADSATERATHDYVLLYAPPWSGPTRFSKHHLAGTWRAAAGASCTSRRR